MPLVQVRSCLRKIPAQVLLVTTASPSQPPIATTCNSFTSLSLSPPTVSISLRKNGVTSLTILESKTFALNFLSTTQEHLARRYATIGGHDTDDLGIKKFEDTPYVGEGCCSVLVCRLAESRDVHDHTVFVGEVVEVFEGASEGLSPLLYHEGKYTTSTC